MYTIKDIHNHNYYILKQNLLLKFTKSVGYNYLILNPKKFIDRKQN